MVYQRAKTATESWTRALKDIVENGEPRVIRGREVLEILNYQTTVDLAFPVVTNRARNLGYRFMAAEAHWILSGDNKVSTIKPYAKNIVNYSDDGLVFTGAYGPKIVDQLNYVCDKLIDDPSTRQAVINIWRENPRNTKDTPCTLSYQIQIRDGRIFATDTMRSSDIWLGWPYDIFNFTMLTTFIVQMLKERGVDWASHLKTGHLVLNAGSLHLYIDDLELARNVLATIETDKDYSKGKEYKPLNIHSFVGTEDLLTHLRRFANKQVFKDAFLEELQNV